MYYTHNRAAKRHSSIATHCHKNFRFKLPPAPHINWNLTSNTSAIFISLSKLAVPVPQPAAGGTVPAVPVAPLAVNGSDHSTLNVTAIELELTSSSSLVA